MKLAASKSSKIFRQTLAFFLAMLMFLTILPPTAFAEPGEGNGVNDDTDNMTVDVITPPDTNYGGGNGYEPDADPPRTGGENNLPPDDDLQSPPPYADEDEQYTTPEPTGAGVVPYNVPLPPVPVNLRIEAALSGSFRNTISWDAANMADQYIIERRITTPGQNFQEWDAATQIRFLNPSGDPTPEFQLESGRFRFIDNNVEPGVSYQYRIIAVYYLNTRPPAEPPDSLAHTHQVLVSGILTRTATPLTAPHVPGLHSNGFSISLTWAPVTIENATVTYNVWRWPETSTDPDDDRVNLTLGAPRSVPNFVDHENTPGIRYVYQIQVLRDGDHAGYSATRTLTNPPAAPLSPANLNPELVGTMGQYSATIQWRTNITNIAATDRPRANDHEVWRRVQNPNGTWPGTDFAPGEFPTTASPNGWVQIDNLFSTGNIEPNAQNNRNQITDNGLLPGRLYQYMVVAIWDIQDRPYALRVGSTARTLPIAPTLPAPRTGDVDIFEREIRWDAPEVPNSSAFHNHLSGFDVFRRSPTEPDNWTRVNETTPLPLGASNYFDRTASPYGTYDYAIVAHFDNGEAKQTGRSQFIRVPLEPPITASLLRPTVTVEEIFNATVRWRASGRADTYIVERRVAAPGLDPEDNWQEIYTQSDTTNRPAEWWTTTEPHVITHSTTYQYRIVAEWVEDPDNPPSANNRVVRMPSDVLEVTSNLHTFARPDASAHSPTSVELSWAAAPQAVRYEVKMVDATGNQVRSRQVPNLPAGEAVLRSAAEAGTDYDVISVIDGLSFIWNRLDWNHIDLTNYEHIDLSNNINPPPTNITHTNHGEYRFMVRPIWRNPSGADVPGAWVPVRRYDSNDSTVTPTLHENETLNLSLSPLNQNSIRLDWTPRLDFPSVGNSQGYLITRTDELTLEPVTFSLGNISHFIDRTVIPGRTYTYSIQHIWTRDGGLPVLGRPSYPPRSESTQILVPQNFRWDSEWVPQVENARLTTARFTWTRLDDESGILGYRIVLRGPIEHVIHIPKNEETPDWIPANATPGTMGVEIEGLWPDAFYEARIQVYWTTNINQPANETLWVNGNQSAPQNFRTDAVTPTWLTAPTSSLRETSVTLRWNLIPGVNNAPVHYRVYRDGVPISDIINVTSFTDHNLMPGTTARYTVRAVWPVGETPLANNRRWDGALSSELPVTAPGQAPADFRQTTDTAGTTVSSLGPMDILVRWDDLPNEALYFITLGYRGGIVGTETMELHDGTTYRVFRNLLPGVEYQARIVGIWDAGDTRPHDFIGTVDEWNENRFREGPAAEVSFTITAPAPARVRAHDTIRHTPQSIAVQWNHITTAGIRGYNVFVGDVSENAIPAYTIRWGEGGTGPNFAIIPNLAPNTLYPVRVEGVWGAPGAETSGLSSPVLNTIRTTGPAPTRLAVQVVNRVSTLRPTRVTLTWNALADMTGVTGFLISKDGEPYHFERFIGTTWVTTWEDENLIPGRVARYTVAAVWGYDGNDLREAAERAGIASAILTVNTPGPAPAGLRRISPAPAPWNFNIEFSTLTGVHADRVIRYNVFIGDREIPIEVSARRNLADANILSTSLTDGSIPRTGRIPLSLNNFDYRVQFNCHPDPQINGGCDCAYKLIAPNTQYNIRVQAVWLNGAGEEVEGPKSAQLAVTTAGATPTGVRQVASSRPNAIPQREIGLEWTRINNALGYRIIVSYGDNREHFRELPVENTSPPALRDGATNWPHGHGGAGIPWHPTHNPNPLITANNSANNRIRAGNTAGATIVDDLRPNTTYFVQVQAYWAVGANGVPIWGNLSAPVQIRTAGAAPSLLAAGAATVPASYQRMPQWQWNRATAGHSNIQGFLIYRNGVPHEFVEFDPTNVSNPDNLGGNTALVVTRDRTGNVFTIRWRDNAQIPGVPVSYMVQAFWGNPRDASGNWSQEFGGLISVARTITPAGGAPPTLRAGAAQHVATATSLNLTWNRIAATAIPAGAILHGFDVQIAGKDTERILEAWEPRVEFTGLEPNTIYPVTLTMIWNINGQLRPGRSATLNMRTTNPVPSQPTFVANSNTGTSVRLNWNAPPAPTANQADARVTGYIVYRNDSRVAIRPHSFVNYRFEDTGLTPGIAARYTVRAFWCVGGADCTHGNNLDNLLEPAANDPPCLRIGSHSVARVVNPPGAVPGRVRIANANPTRFSVVWNPVSLPAANIHAYIVEIWRDGVNITESTDFDTGNFDRVQRIGEGIEQGIILPARDTREVTFTGLDPNTRYHARVRAVWDAGRNPERLPGNGAFICTTCVDAASPTLIECTACRDDWTRYRKGNFTGLVNAQTNGPAPGGLRVVGAASNVSARITWNPVTVPDVLGYMIYRNSVPVFFISDLTFRQNGNSWLDTSLSPGVAVRYTVRAYWCADPHCDLLLSHIGDEPCLRPGNRSAALTVTPRPSVPVVSWRAISATSAQITWTAPPSDAGVSVREYRVEVLQGGSVIDVIPVIRPVPARHPRIVLLSNLEPNTTYQVRVTPIWEIRDENLPREGRPSNLVNVRTAGPAPAGLRMLAESRTNTSARLTWNTVADPDVVGYMVYRNGEAVGYISRSAFVAAGNTWEDLRLHPGTLARYTVRAVWMTQNPDLGEDAPFPEVPGVINDGRGMRVGNVSATVNVTPLGAAPRGVSATVNNRTSLTVRWNALAINANNPWQPNHFLVRVEHPTRAAEDGMSFMQVVDATDLRVLRFDGLQPNVRYRVTVAGIWDAGQGTHVDNSRCSIPNLTINPITRLIDGIPPACDRCGWIRYRVGVSSAVHNAPTTGGPAPGGLRIVPGTSTSTGVSLTWNIVMDPDVVGYVITRVGDPHPFHYISAEQFRFNNNIWTFNGQNPGVASRFTVQATWEVPTLGADGRPIPLRDGNENIIGVVGAKLGIPSGALSVTAPDGGRPAPAGVVARVISPMEIAVTWNDVPGVHGYRVQLLRGGVVVADSGPDPILRGDERSHTFGADHVYPNTQYQVRVVGVWNMGTSTNPDIRDGRVSGVVNVRTTGPAPTGLRVALARDSMSFNAERRAWDVRLTWNPVPDAQGYLLYSSLDDPFPTFITADQFDSLDHAGRFAWIIEDMTPNTRVTFSVQAVWGPQPNFNISDHDENGNWIPGTGNTDARGNWIPNGKIGIRSANLNVTPPLP